MKTIDEIFEAVNGVVQEHIQKEYELKSILKTTTYLEPKGVEISAVNGLAELLVEKNYSDNPAAVISFGVCESGGFSPKLKRPHIVYVSKAGELDIVDKAISKATMEYRKGHRDNKKLGFTDPECELRNGKRKYDRLSYESNIIRQHKYWTRESEIVGRTYRKCSANFSGVYVCSFLPYDKGDNLFKKLEDQFGDLIEITFEGKSVFELV